jgi:hypothetical protein
MMDDPNDLDDPTKADYDVKKWSPSMEVMIKIESLNLDLKV